MATVHKDIEQKLKDAIFNSAMNCQRISDLSGVSKAALSLFMNGKRSLTLPSAAKIAKVLDLDLVHRSQVKR